MAKKKKRNPLPKVSSRRLGYAGIAGLLGLSLMLPGSETEPVSTGEIQELMSLPELPAFLSGEEREANAMASVASANAAEWDLPNLDHPRIDYWIERFTTDKRDEFEGFLARKGLYEEMILQKLDERDMPRDLLYLAMIESGFKAKAYSSAAASGIWQFIAPTGQRYGLDINRAIDERNDPERATDAALHYLSDLHDRFGSWYLAAASYNTGENRVGRIMRQVTGSERGHEEDYYRIWDRLPRETRDYVPLMIAAARISKDPARYGFDHVEPLPAMQFETVVARPATPLSEIARQAGMNVNELKQLNPQLKMERTRNDETSVVRVNARG